MSLRPKPAKVYKRDTTVREQVKSRVAAFEISLALPPDPNLKCGWMRYPTSPVCNKSGAVAATIPDFFGNPREVVICHDCASQYVKDVKKRWRLS